ncbi:MAG: hypothetical protein JWM47_3264 [Acidimicrobiales bacterium]|nr:hypothetical protein [Acidimicrobiales bacterium]
MSDTPRNKTPVAEPTIQDILRTAKPMDDLDQFGIHDLTREEAARFFKVLEDT